MECPCSSFCSNKIHIADKLGGSQDYFSPSAASIISDRLFSFSRAMYLMKFFYLLTCGAPAWNLFFTLASPILRIILQAATNKQNSQVVIEVESTYRDTLLSCFRKLVFKILLISIQIGIKVERPSSCGQ